MRGKEVSYNDRLFGAGGLRGWYHNARYHWISQQLADTPGSATFFELGCFDAKLINNIPNGFARYVGVDANWEKGLDLGRKRFADRKDVTLIEMREPASMARFEDKSFDYAVSMETLEHIPDDLLTGYLQQVARVTRGRFYVTVPNEMGPVFLVKHFGKIMMGGADQKYRPAEVLAAATFRSDAIERFDHKGFDYRKLAKLMAADFEVEYVGPVPKLPLPAALAPSVGIVARPR